LLAATTARGITETAQEEKSIHKDIRDRASFSGSPEGHLEN
jgi:hypothetical protein